MPEREVIIIGGGAAGLAAAVACKQKGIEDIDLVATRKIEKKNLYHLDESVL